MAHKPYPFITINQWLLGVCAIFTLWISPQKFEKNLNCSRLPLKRQEEVVWWNPEVKNLMRLSLWISKFSRGQNSFHPPLLAPTSDTESVHVKEYCIPTVHSAGGSEDSSHKVIILYQSWALALIFQVRSPLCAHFLTKDRYRSSAPFADFQVPSLLNHSKKTVVSSWKRALKRKNRS